MKKQQKIDVLLQPPYFTIYLLMVFPIYLFIYLFFANLKAYEPIHL